jgi:hypothetical protein
LDEPFVDDSIGASVIGALAAALHSSATILKKEFSSIVGCVAFYCCAASVNKRWRADTLADGNPLGDIGNNDIAPASGQQ